MNYYLAKTDPLTYSMDDLKKDKQTIWDGIHSNQAMITLNKMEVEDIVLIYHSLVGGKEGPGIVGLAKVSIGPRLNIKDPRKSIVVDLTYIRHFRSKILLKDIKDSNLFNDWALIKQSRLSTMPVPIDFIKWLNNVYKLEI